MHEQQIRDYLYGYKWLNSDIKKLQSYNAYLTNLDVAPWYVAESRKRVEDMRLMQKAIKTFFRIIPYDEPIRKFLVEKYFRKDKDGKMQSLETVLQNMGCDESTYWKYDQKSIRKLKQIIDES